MKKLIFIVAVTAIGLMACNLGFSQSEGGMLYKIHHDQEGKTIKEGDFISLNVVVKTDGDSLLFSSYETGRPSVMLARKPAYKGDLFSGLVLLSEGDSATLKLPTDTMFARTGQQRPPQLKDVKFMIYQIKVEKIIARDTLSEQSFQAKVSEFFKAEGEQAQRDEKVKMDKYIAESNLKPAVTSSGLNYVIVKPTDGIKPSKGDTVSVNYTGKLLNGKVFDTSVKEVAEKNKIYDAQRPYSPIKFALGEGRVIPGWDEGLMLLTKGSKATFIIPSKLGYGEQGAGASIPPFSTLIVEVELVDITAPQKIAKVVPVVAEKNSTTKSQSTKVNATKKKK